MNGRTAIVCVLSAAAIGTAGGWRLGAEREKERGLAAYHALSAACAEERRGAAAAHAEALAEALASYEAEARRMRRQADALNAEKKQLAGEARQLRKEMARATQNSTHVYGSDFVRMLNRATGGVNRAQAGAVLESADSGGAHGAPGPAASAGAGVCGAGTAGSGDGAVKGGPSTRNASGGTAGVTEADLGAWLLDYAERCRKLEAQLAALQEAARLEAEPPDEKRGRE